jgi:hypothetical protein
LGAGWEALTVLSPCRGPRPHGRRLTL